MDFQLSLPGTWESGKTLTYAGCLLDLWSIWSGGNYAPTVAQVNHTLAQMEKRLALVTKAKSTAIDNGRFYFVNVSVGDDDIDRIDELFPTPEQTFQLLTGVLIDGLKVSFSVNAKNDMTICSLSDRREASPTFGACLTGGADGWYDALCVCLYKYTALLHGDLSEATRSNGPSRRII